MSSSIITPKNAIDLVLAHKARSEKLKLYETPVQKALLLVATVSLIAGAVLGIASYGSHNSPVALLALILLFVSMVVATGYQLAIVVPELLKLRSAEKDFASPLSLQFNGDIDLISNLASDYQPQHLQYAATNFSLAAEQLRSRISLLVGAIDKVGIIPLAVTAYLSGMKALRDGVVVFGGAEWLLVVFILLYLFAIRMSVVAQWMDRAALLYRTALDLKRGTWEA